MVAFWGKKKKKKIRRSFFTTLILTVYSLKQIWYQACLKTQRGKTQGVFFRFAYFNRTCML